jgi:hypothetical protein
MLALTPFRHKFFLEHPKKALDLLTRGSSLQACSWHLKHQSNSSTSSMGKLYLNFPGRLLGVSKVVKLVTSERHHVD